MNLAKIGQAIDGILDRDQAWTKHEHDFYQMIVNKAARYQKRAKAYKLNSHDKEHILNNIREQQWFQVSAHKSVILNLVKGMDIDLYQYSANAQRTELKLRIKFQGGVFFNVKYLRTAKSVQSFVYFSGLCGGNKVRGNLCYLDTTNNLEQQKELKLPDYDQIFGLINNRQRRLDRFDIVHLASELIMYYDTQAELAGVNMGQNYPISLIELAKITEQPT